MRHRHVVIRFWYWTIIVTYETERVRKGYSGAAPNIIRIRSIVQGRWPSPNRMKVVHWRSTQPVHITDCVNWSENRMNKSHVHVRSVHVCRLWRSSYQTTRNWEKRPKTSSEMKSTLYTHIFFDILHNQIVIIKFPWTMIKIDFKKCSLFYSI